MDDEKDQGPLRLDEIPHGMLEGFLSEYWRSGSDLPRLRGFGVLSYYLRRGFTNLWALPGSAVISVLSIAVSLFVFAGLLLVLGNIGTILSRLGSTLSVVAYLREDAQQSQVNDYVRELEANPRVRSVRFISKETALEELKADFGNNGKVLKGIENDNPLPASLDILLQNDELRMNSTEQILSDLRSRPFVEEISYGTEWVEKVARMLRGFRALSLGALLVVLALVVTLISNTIKLVLYLRRDEIAVMQLVGASDSFVKIPFILTGLLQGLAGGFLALGSLRLVFSLLARNMEDSTVLGILIPAPTFLELHGMLAVLCLGLVVGSIGSFFAVGRFMKV